jgi:adenylosuccinate synthase
LTKLDVLFPSVKEARHLSGLDEKANTFVSKIERETGVPVTLIGTGPAEEDIIDLRNSNRPIKTKPLLVQRR